MTEALVVTDVTLSYPTNVSSVPRAATPGRFVAVDSASFRVADGEVVALLGSSGSGKSSLLRAIAGIEAIDSGTIEIRGRDVTVIPTHLRNIGLVFQDGQLFANRNVERNIAYGLEAQGVAQSQRLERVNELLDLVKLTGYNNRDIATLSGGQAQRVALARTLAPRPDVLLLDEPLSALDTHMRMSLAADLRRIIVQSGVPAVYVTHDRAEAELVADRILYIDAGELRADNSSSR